MVKAGDSVTYIDGVGRTFPARVLQIFTDPSKKNPVINIEYLNLHKVKQEVRSLQHESDKPENVEGKKVECWK